MGKLPCPRVFRGSNLALIGPTFHRVTLEFSRRGSQLASRRGMNPSFSLSRSVARGFGATMGAIFEVGKSALEARQGRAPNAAVVGSGIGFGTFVWIASYAGGVPAARVMPSPSKDRPGRPTSMEIAHWIFGATLGAFGARIRPPSAVRDSASALRHRARGGSRKGRRPPIEGSLRRPQD